MLGNVFLPVTVIFTCLFICHFGSEAAEKFGEDLLFDSFIANYSREYKNDLKERNLRFKIFQQSLVRQAALNEAEKLLGGTAKYGINKFSDLTPEEFQKLRLSPRRYLPPNQRTQGPSDLLSAVNLTRFDWRDSDKIGPIRDQYQCGSCWAFAVVETIASAYAIQNKEKLQHILSAQQVISCDMNPTKGLSGCDGGVLFQAFLTLQDMQLILVDDSIYPFKSVNGQVLPCLGNLPNQGIMLRKFFYLEKATPSQMTELLSVSPLTTSVNAVAWQDYLGGIVQHHCTDNYVDHAVQVVGYDFTGDVPYWIVRNTWGTDWGEDGYIRILYSDENLCGLQDEVAIVNSTASVNF